MSKEQQHPLVSVVIPAYNQAEYVCQAIASVLDQTYSELEVLVVNDASTDNTAAVLQKIHDSRVRVISHQKNSGLSAARNSGIRASRGDLIAFLDADDFFHVEKIARHVDFLRTRPGVGVTYNARFELNHSQTTVRELWRPAVTCGLTDFMAGFPFAPSDMVVRREWLTRAGLFDESLLFYSEDLDINCRLAMAGCRFASVDAPLNFRRYYSGRALSLRERLAAALSVLERVCRDQRCPPDAFAFRWEARATHLMVWAFCAFCQNEPAIGREYLNYALELQPAYLYSGAQQLLEFLLQQSVADDNLDHLDVMKTIIEQCPRAVKIALRGWEAPARNAYLLRAVRAAIWDRVDDAQRLFTQAHQHRAEADRRTIGALATQLLNIRELMGEENARTAMDRISHVAPAGYGLAIRRIKACYFLNKGFRDFHASGYRDVLGDAGSAVRNDPRCAANRGLLSISARSAWRLLSNPNRHTHATAD